MRYRSHEPHRTARYIALGAFFAICCCIFAVRLIYYQIAVRDDFAVGVFADGDVRTVTVKAQRGNICDRNGVVLVTNSYTYDMIFEYGAMPDTRAEVHSVLISAKVSTNFHRI